MDGCRCKCFQPQKVQLWKRENLRVRRIITERTLHRLADAVFDAYSSSKHNNNGKTHLERYNADMVVR